MNKKETIKELLLEFQRDSIPDLFKRETIIPSLPINIRKALIFIGMRRVGKTYLMFQHMRDAISHGIAKKNLAYINFEDDRLASFVLEDFQLILDSYFELYPENANSQKLIFYFDEIQNVAGWDKFIRRLIDREKMQIIITGSSAKSLSKEIATSLRGRSLATEVFPLQLREFLNYHQVNWESPIAKDRSIIKHYMEIYLERGGFPEILNAPDALYKTILQSYVDTAVFRDVIDRNQLNQPHVVKLFLIHCLQNIASPLSVTKIHKTLKSRGENIGRNSLYEYLQYFEDAYLLCSVPIFDLSTRKRQVNPSKIYCIDPGIIYSYSVKPQCEKGTSLENATYLHLRASNYENIFYYKTHSGREVDFVAQKNNGELLLIQACIDIEEEQTREREINALIESGKELGTQSALIITLDQEEIIENQEMIIHVIPYWKWVLSKKD